MSNAVLICIKPQWCALIASGKKTIEVRKTRPKIDTPFKCYIYCTKPKYLYDDFFCIGAGTEKARTFYGGGKVIGEFVCDKIRCIMPDSFIVKEDEERALRGTCFAPEQVKRYGGWKSGTHLSKCKDLYGWHISDLVIYDHPKELSEFHRPCTPQCNFSEECGGSNAADCLFSINRPPQSWCYVEKTI